MRPARSPLRRRTVFGPGAFQFLTASTTPPSVSSTVGAAASALRDRVNQRVWTGPDSGRRSCGHLDTQGSCCGPPAGQGCIQTPTSEAVGPEVLAALKAAGLRGESAGKHAFILPGTSPHRPRAARRLGCQPSPVSTVIPDAVSQSAFSTVVDEGGSFDVIFPEGFNFKRDALKHRDGQRSSVEDSSGSRSGSAPSQCCLFSQSCDLWLVDAYRATVRMMDCIAAAFTCPEPVAGSAAYNMIEKELQTAATTSAAHAALRPSPLPSLLGHQRRTSHFSVPLKTRLPGELPI